MADILSELASNRRAGTIAEVVDIMTAIDRELPEGDGIRWFNRLYLQVTRSVRSVVGTSTFRDPAFLERLDVVFANLYFDALVSGARNPRMRRRPGGRCSNAAAAAASCRFSSRSLA